MTNTTRQTVIIAAAALLVIAAAVAWISLPGLLERRIHQLRLESRWTAATTTQSRLVALFPGSAPARRAVLLAASDLLSGPDEILITGSGWVTTRGRGVQPTGEAIELVLSHIHRVANRQREAVHGWSLGEREAQILALIGNRAEARELMVAVAQGLAAEGLAMRALAARTTMIGWIESPAERGAAAVRALSDATRPYQRAPLYLLAADASLEAGDYSRAREHYEAAVEAEMQNIARADRAANDAPPATAADQPVYARARFQLSFLDYLESRETEPGAELEGSVTILGSPPHSATVYLTPTADERTGVFTHLIEERSFVRAVDTNGGFRFEDLPPGRYRVTLGVRHEHLVGSGQNGIPDFLELSPGEMRRVDLRLSARLEITTPAGSTTLPAGPRVEFPVSWEPVAGAASYSLDILYFFRDDANTITGWISRATAEAVRDTSTTVRMEGPMLLESPGISYGETLNPVSVLGGWYPDNPVGLRIQAFDADGRKRADSEGYLVATDENYPLITMAGSFEERFGAAADAARATAMRDYETALSAWRAVLDSDTVDPASRATAALAIARITLNLREYGYPDPQVARAAYQRFLELTAGMDLPERLRQEAEHGAGLAPR